MSLKVRLKMANDRERPRFRSRLGLLKFPITITGGFYESKSLSKKRRQLVITSSLILIILVKIIPIKR
jgi:hypothetical protein